MPFFLQIFRKDVRRLAPFLLAVLSLQTVFAIGTTHSVGLVDPEGRLEAILGFIEVLLFVCWALLIALVILEDPLVGDNSFWITRPYSWRSLLAAKVLFALAFLNLPLLISDCAILKFLGLQFDFVHLLLRQLPLIALVIIPVFAFAAISNRLSQFWLFLVIALVLMAVESFATAEKFHGLFSFVKVPDTIALTYLSLCALPAIAIQFARRVNYTRFWLGALFAGTIPVIFFTTHLVQNGAFFVQRHPQTTPGNRWQQIHVELGSNKPHDPGTDAEKAGVWLGLNVPLRVQGLPPGVILGGEGETFVANATKSLRATLLRDTDSAYHLHMDFRARVLSNVAISIRSSLQVWVLNDAPTFKKVLRRFELVKIPNTGICQLLIEEKDLICWQGPLRPPALTIATHSWNQYFFKEPSTFMSDDESGFYDEMIWDLSPIDKRTLKFDDSHKLAPGEQISFTPHFLIASVHRDIIADKFPLFDATPGFNGPYIFKKLGP